MTITSIDSCELLQQFLIRLIKMIIIQVFSRYTIKMRQYLLMYYMESGEIRGFRAAQADARGCPSARTAPRCSRPRILLCATRHAISRASWMDRLPGVSSPSKRVCGQVLPPKSSGCSLAKTRWNFISGTFTRSKNSSKLTRKRSIPLSVIRYPPSEHFSTVSFPTAFFKY